MRQRHCVSPESPPKREADDTAWVTVMFSRTSSEFGPSGILAGCVHVKGGLTPV